MGLSHKYPFLILDYPNFEIQRIAIFNLHTYEIEG